LGTNVVAYSDNGINWIASTLPFSDTWRSVTCSGSGRFVAVAQGNTSGAYSDNGSTWSSMTLPSASSWFGVSSK
jgi:hypothetical protein